MNTERCPWCGDEPRYVAYHDEEWGVPQHDDRMLFEMLNLEGAQAGLSWRTVLYKREGYRRAFDNFDAERIARYDDTDVARLVADPGIVRHAGKIRATIGNARAFLDLQAAEGSFDRWLWQFVDGRPQINHWRTLAEVPAKTPLSDTLSRELKRRGFKFVGSTICYAFAQAVGLVNDHLVGCHRHAPLARTPD
ncbi:DNA-3-methyladenine glycosylase I [Denitromonas iodatirespirans]|uniref:DNA-3-methyladenine glycosylase I n=1 Tax=Denitromonas iodatirespirans TaxID=2795389 RepID=A0A944DAG4_DENI1|nr:DNA-3-methyladenine glycosylase I [Denitromonas iodatirespirans]MBT0961416.1 DNA-3-methyladenine glycosylase I [Denitromonas iodatirespirans]